MSLISLFSIIVGVIIVLFLFLMIRAKSTLREKLSAIWIPICGIGVITVVIITQKAIYFGLLVFVAVAMRVQMHIENKRKLKTNDTDDNDGNEPD
jgi:hypothetical protein